MPASPTAERPRMAASRLRELLHQSREDIAALMAASYDNLAEQHRLLQINTELFGLLGEEAPDVTPRVIVDHTDRMAS